MNLLVPLCVNYMLKCASIPACACVGTCIFIYKYVCAFSSILNVIVCVGEQVYVCKYVIVLLRECVYECVQVYV